jgi:hypothetical protein
MASPRWMVPSHRGRPRGTPLAPRARPVRTARRARGPCLAARGWRARWRSMRRDAWAALDRHRTGKPLGSSRALPRGACHAARFLDPAPKPLERKDLERRPAERPRPCRPLRGTAAPAGVVVGR